MFSVSNISSPVGVIGTVIVLETKHSQSANRSSIRTKCKMKYEVPHNLTSHLRLCKLFWAFVIECVTCSQNACLVFFDWLQHVHCTALTDACNYCADTSNPANEQHGQLLIDSDYISWFRGTAYGQFSLNQQNPCLLYWLLNYRL